MRHAAAEQVRTRLLVHFLITQGKNKRRKRVSKIQEAHKTIATFRTINKCYINRRQGSPTFQVWSQHHNIVRHAAAEQVRTRLLVHCLITRGKNKRRRRVSKIQESHKTIASIPLISAQGPN